MTQTGYQPQRARVFYERLREEVQRLPDVTASSMAVGNPLGNSGWKTQVQIEGYHWRSEEGRWVDLNAVAPRYFEVRWNTDMARAGLSRFRQRHGASGPAACCPGGRILPVRHASQL